MREDDVPCCEPEFWVFLIICLVLVTFAGITSGLALGLLSFGQVDLEVLIKAGQPHESRYAAKVLPLVKNEHLLLCTLLVGKSLATEALPIFLDLIFPSWSAIIMSVTLVVAFTEIVPQALFSRYGLSLGAKLSVLVRFLLIILLPVSYPISKILDWLLGRAHSALYRRAELKTLVDLHANEAGRGGDLSRHETRIITGALELTQKTAKDTMTHISETFSLDINSKLDMQMMGLIMSKGHSRIPVYSGNMTNIIGLILAKNLIFCRPEDKTPVKYMTIRRIPRVHEDWPLDEILNMFLKSHNHMAVVLKSREDCTDVSSVSSGKPSMLETDENLNPNPVKVSKARSELSIKQNDPAGFSTYTSPLYSSDSEALSPLSKENPRLESKIPNKDLRSLPSFSDGEVIGIITMEDVMEELLQKEIFDETDEYVDLHNIIRINLPSSRRSPGRVSVTGLRENTPEPSPLSLHSPYNHSPLIKPVIGSSPGPVTSANPSAASEGSITRSPLFQKVLRKSHEKLDPPNA